MSETSTHTDLVLFGQLFRLHGDSGDSNVVLTMAVVSHSGSNGTGPFDSPLGDTTKELSAEAIFAEQLDDILEMMSQEIYMYHTLPVLVRYECAPDSKNIEIQDIRAVTPQTLKQIVDFAWAKEG